MRIPISAASVRFTLGECCWAIGAQTAPRSTPRSIACIEWIDPLMYAANWVPELVDIAGGVAMMGEPGRHSGYFEIEEMVARDPDVIAIMPCGFDIARSRREMPALAARPEWQSLSAVREGRKPR